MSATATPLRLQRTHALPVRTIFSTALRLFSAALLLLITQVVISSVVAGDMSAEASSADQAQLFMGLFGMAFLYAVALSYPVIRSRWHGWKLIAAMFLAFAGVMPALLQAETLVYIVFLVPIVPPELLPRIVVAGILTALVYVPLLVLVWGKLRGAQEAVGEEEGWRFSLGGWIARFVLIGCAYAAIYFAFGMLVAVPLAGPAFSDYYRDLVIPAWMPLFQIVRGVVWAAIMLPILRMRRGPWWEGGLAVAVLSSLLTAGAVVTPNPYMPEAMRFAHFFELLSSNFVFGWAVGWLFRTRQAPSGEK